VRTRPVTGRAPSRRPSALAFRWCVVAAGTVATTAAVAAAADEPTAPANAPLAVVLGGALLLAELRPVRLLRQRRADIRTVSLTYAAALLFLLPGYTAAVAVALTRLLAGAVRGRRWLAALVEAAAAALAMVAATAVLRAGGLRGILGRGDLTPRSAAVLLAAFAALYVVHHALLGTVAALSSDEPVRASLRAGLRDALATDGILLALSPVLVVVGDRQPLLLPFAMALTVAVHRSAREAAAHQESAIHDPLTGLANRRQLDDRAEAALERAARTGQHPAVLIIDLDGFKAINDTHGHAAGDQVLCAVASTLTAWAPPGATVARLGGDEFAVLLPATAGPQEAEAAGADVAALFPLTVALDVDRSPVVEVGASVGCATRLKLGDGVGDLIRAADLAMYHAKRDGTGYHAAERAQDTGPDLLAELERAIAEDVEHPDRELHLAFQPVVDVRTQVVNSVEALLRWDHPTLGRIRPDEFIPLAETSPLIDPLTDLVVRKAARFMADAHRAGHRIGVAINVSGRNLVDVGFADRLAATLERFDVDPVDLTVEITETALVDDLDRARASLDALHRLGVQVALDDFGSGYSSLTKLRDLPVTCIKIDRSFLATPEDVMTDQLLLTLVQLGRAMGLAVTAEGVESDVQLAAILAAGCDEAQGYLFGHPRPAGETLAWLGGRSADAPVRATLPPMPVLVEQDEVLVLPEMTL
jgi:diguanylate cyclase